ncbi:MAG: MATE family efflux transporter [Treponema sp.]|nr:MATE family efflux transporter [Treponema sp.]
MNNKTKVVAERRPPDFGWQLATLVIPITMQNLISAGVGAADVFMLSFVNQTAIAGVSLASQLVFVHQLFLSTIATGATMLAAQYWGKRDTAAIEKILGIALGVSLIVNLVFFIFAFFFNTFFMGLFSTETDLIETGALYLKTASPIFLLTGFSQVYLCVKRSVERVRTAVAINSLSLLLNVFFNAIAIFGLFGFPKSGVYGVAAATVLSRLIEVLCCVIDSLISKSIQIKPKNIFRFDDTVLFKDFIHYSLPVGGNYLVWGLGFTMYSLIMGRLGGDMAAANAASSVVRSLVTATAGGLAGGGGILLGKEMGQSLFDKARKDAGRLCRAALLCGIAGGLLVLVTRPLVISVMRLNESAKTLLGTMLLINAYYVIGKTINSTIIVGIFCAGGDSRFGLVCDAFTMWGFAVPLGMLAAFVFRFPPMAVYFILFLDEFVKIPFIYRHYHQYGWLKNITRKEKS